MSYIRFIENIGAISGRKFVFSHDTNIGTQIMVYICHRTLAVPRSCDEYRSLFSTLYLSQGLKKPPITHIYDALLGPNLLLFYLESCLATGALLLFLS